MDFTFDNPFDDVFSDPDIALGEPSNSLENLSIKNDSALNQQIPTLTSTPTPTLTPTPTPITYNVENTTYGQEKMYESPNKNMPETSMLKILKVNFFLYRVNFLMMSYY